jgi:hypothetical protein
VTPAACPPAELFISMIRRFGGTNAMNRTIRADRNGPGLLRLRLPVGRITVIAAKDHRRATVRLTPQQANDQAAVEAIERTEVAQSGATLAVTVPSAGGSGMTQTVVQSGGRVVVSQTAGDVTGSMVGITISGGGISFGNGGTVVIGARGSGIDAEVTVPVGQRVELDTDAADVTSTGQLAALHVDTGSGDIQFTDADTADLTTGSGDIYARQSGDLQARTGSGDITVRAATGSTTLRTGSGDVRVHLAAQVPLKVRTGSGDIRATAALGIAIARSALRTGSGRITTR